MKILTFEIENNKLIRAFYLDPQGDNVHVAGKSNEGKTTAISGLWDIIHKQGSSLSHGEKKGFIRITLGDNKKTIIAERVMTAKTNTVKIKYKSGEPIKPSDFSNMISDLSIDPHKIMELKPQAKMNMLLKSADLGGLNLEALDAEILGLESKKLELFQRAKALTPGEEPEFAEKVLVQELINKHIELGEKQGNYESIERSKIEVEKSIKAEEEKLNALKAKLNNANAFLENPENQFSQTEIKEIKEKIENSELINQKANAFSVWTQRSLEYETAKESHTAIDQEVKTKKKSRESVLENAKWPIEGLSINKERNIIYNGCELNNLGDSQQMLVCAGLAVINIANHPIKVVRIDGAESMSPEDFEKLVKLFKDKDVQILSTRVARNDVEDNEIEICDGEYVEAC